MAFRLDNFLLSAFVAQFRRAAIVFNFGLEDERRNMQEAGIESLNEALMMLDSNGEDGRLALLPLLDDREPGARVYAARYLMEVAPDRALATLKDLMVNAEGNARHVASMLFADHLERERKQ